MILFQSLNFDEEEFDEEMKTFDKTKTAVIAHEVTKRANHESLLGSNPAKDSKNLATFLAEDLELDLSKLMN